MKTSGVFFLRGRPCSSLINSRSSEQVHGWLFSLGERTSSRGVASFTAIWPGPEADRFMKEHPRLRAGDCLALDLDRLHATGNELRGFITRCELAPPRWPEPPHTEGAERAVGTTAARARPTGAAGSIH